MFGKRRCGVCGRSYRREEDLMNHIQTEHGAPEYDCSECGKKFPSMEDMRAHLKASHSYRG